MTNVNYNPAAGQAYQAYPSNYTQQTQGVSTQNVAASPYVGDAYSSGYTQGVGATGGVAAGMTGLSGGIGSMANSMGGIFGTIIDLIASILNTVVNLIAKLIEGVVGLFGGGKKDKTQGVGAAGGANQAMPLPGNQGMGVASPAGTAVPPPPPGTDINAAYNVVNGDLQGVSDPSQGLQIINLHSQKARDYRDKAEQFAKEAEKESRSAMYSAEALQKNPGDQKALSELQGHKSKAMDLLKTAQEYTKAVYDESLYAQAANDILNSKFKGAMGSEGNTQVTESWKNWIGGTIERKFLFFKENIKPAPELFMASMNVVNANIGRATQVISTLSTGVR